ncbi:MAG TPA: M48 family metalloprotease [Verrucomicrobiae bacterium]|jgi:Zn-dependent protease with chaperone function/tetratricopeptide (TPR) repeat protein|nr:M48 family metalloprotease [Verrucomicrobiae bacterium]
MKATANEGAGEKPLGRGARLILVLSVGVVMLSFYLFSVFAILALLLLIAVELVLLVALSRFAAGRLMAPYVAGHFNLLTLLIRSFRLRKGLDFKIPLQRDDAPALYDLLKNLCRRLDLAFPREIVLQMGDGAWVQLRGIRSGSGKVTLGVGYDLLAGLTVAEMEAVFAHEMSHAKLVSRGYKNWLGAGQARLRTLAVALWNVVTASRRAKVSATVARGLFIIVDWFVRVVTRLVATYSRQDEFEADRGAAALCGSAAMKSALSRLDSLHRITSRLPWSERVAHLQQTNGYSQWLLQEITDGMKPPVGDSGPQVFNQYSTHPSIRDRLAALPPDDKVAAADSPCGIGLLAHPDAVAFKLLAQLQRLLVEQERKDSRVLGTISRKLGRHTHLQRWQWLGLLLALGGFMFGSVSLCAGAANLISGVWCLGAIVAGIFIIRLGRYRDRLILAVPAYTKLIEPREKSSVDALKQKENAIHAEIVQRFTGESRGKRAAALARESYAALEKCNYLHAHVAARQCLKSSKRSVEGALAQAVACAAFGQVPTVIRLLAFVQRRTGFSTFSTCWGSAWAASLAGDWVRSETMLEKAIKMEPQHVGLLSLLALAQFHRGKHQSAIANGRLACEADPGSRDKLKFLIARLVDCGFTNEAEEWLKRLDTASETDTDLVFSLVQLNLLRRNFDKAGQWTARIRELDKSPHSLVRLGKLYERARQDDRAVTLYQQALELGHFPEAHLGLGRIETERGNKVEARRHTLAALNTDLPVGEKGVTSWQILHPILSQMLWLEEPAANCRAWIASFPPNVQPAPLAGQSLIVYAPDLQQAQGHLTGLLEALQPGKPPGIFSSGKWSPAPRPMQPHGPVRPGVQGVWK